MLFKNIVLKAINKLSSQEKEQLRKSLEDDLAKTNVEDTKVEDKDNDENESVTTELNENLKEKEDMPNGENEKKTEVEETEVEKKKEDVEEVDNNENVGNAENGNPTNNENQVDNGEVEGEANAQVTETEGESNGLRIEDLVTKDELMARLSAFEAKYDALVKENQSLKDKYENNDFGGMQKRGVMQKERGNQTSKFDDYSRDFK